MLITYNISYKIPKSTLDKINLELYSGLCNFQIRYFKSYLQYIISDYFDYNKEHQKQFMEIVMKYATEHILSFHYS